MGTGFKYLALLVLPLLASCSTVASVGKSSLSCGGKSLAAELCSIACDSKPVRKAAVVGDVPAETELCSPTKTASACNLSPETKESVCNLNDILNGKKNPAVPDLTFPVDGGCLSSPFGYRRGIFHSGLDISACKGDPITACADGRVVFTGSRKGYRSYGLAVLLDHGRNVYTHYAHMSRILVRKGQKVAAGEKIGLVGSTGRSTSPHLHLEVKVGSQFYNPLAYFPSGEIKRIEVAKSFSETPMGPVSSRRRFSSHRYR
jgi:murein DD-endopeptidase MepM/ murein hydrolase activator NlpD